MSIVFNENDGGRAAAGFKGKAGDCVVRAIAIATGLPYKKVYDDLFEANAEYATSGNSRVARKLRDKGATPRAGNHKEVYKKYIESHGFEWVACMQIGSGCKMHLDADELPSGTLICRLSRHICAVIDGVIQDDHDPSRGGSRCVYGYWIKRGREQ